MVGEGYVHSNRVDETSEAIEHLRGPFESRVAKNQLHFYDKLRRDMQVSQMLTTLKSLVQWLDILKINEIKPGHVKNV